MLTLHYIPEDEHHGELRAQARHGGFSGQSSAWFNTQALRGFAHALRSYPLELDQPVTLKGGYFSDSVTSAAPVETQIGIGIAQLGTRGRLWAQISLCEPDETGLAQAATVSFVVEPYALLRFAEQILAMLDRGGSAGLAASNEGREQPGTLTARAAIERPLIPLLNQLRDDCNALVDRMERSGVGVGAGAPCPDGLPLIREEWELYDPGLILATIDWDGARLILNWAVDDENPIRAARSPDYILSLHALKSEAQGKDHPRAWFESHALYLLHAAQSHLGDFYRDGPTDDIPYDRHLIHAQGMAQSPAAIWVGNVILRYDDRQ